MAAPFVLVASGVRRVHYYPERRGAANFFRKSGWNVGIDQQCPAFPWPLAAGMIRGMKRRLLCLICSVVVLATPVLALAKGEEEEVTQNARYLGYRTSVLVDNRSMAVVWLILIGLIVLGLIVMFKNAKRTHLD